MEKQQERVTIRVLPDLGALTKSTLHRTFRVTHLYKMKTDITYSKTPITLYNTYEELGKLAILPTFRRFNFQP